MESDLYLNKKRQEEEKESAEEVLVKNNTLGFKGRENKPRNKWTPKTTIIEGEFHKEENWHILHVDLFSNDTVAVC